MLLVESIGGSPLPAWIESASCLKGYMIEATEVFKRFGDLVAADGISLTIEEGEFFDLPGLTDAATRTTCLAVYKSKNVTGLVNATTGEHLAAPHMKS